MAIDILHVDVYTNKKAPYCYGASMNMAATYSPGTKSSTIGHEGLNYSVRNGKR
jgi:hypothetical protein